MHSGQDDVLKHECMEGPRLYKYVQTYTAVSIFIPTVLKGSKISKAPPLAFMLVFKSDCILRRLKQNRETYPSGHTTFKQRLDVESTLNQGCFSVVSTIITQIQLTLAISNSLISNNRLSRSENLVPA